MASPSCRLERNLSNFPSIIALARFGGYMTDSRDSVSSNNNNLTLPSGGLSSQVWPSNVIATPLEGVTVEVSPIPASVFIAFDILALMKGGKAAEKLAGAPRPSSGSLGKVLTKAAGKAAAGAIAKSVAASHPPRSDESVLESLKTFLGLIPGFDRLWSAVEELF